MRATGHHHRWPAESKDEKYVCECGAWVNDDQMRATNLAHGNRYSPDHSLDKWTAALDEFAAYNQHRSGR